MLQSILLVVMSVITHDFERFASALANVRLHSDWVWWPQNPDSFQKRNMILLTNYNRLFPRTIAAALWKNGNGTTTVRDIIPASRLAKYGNYPYHPEDSGMKQGVSSPETITISDEDLQPWAWKEVDEMFRRLTWREEHNMYLTTSYNSNLSAQITANAGYSEKLNQNVESSSYNHQKEKEALRYQVNSLEEEHLCTVVGSVTVRNIWANSAPLGAAVPEICPVSVLAKPFFPSYLSLGNNRELFPYLQVIASPNAPIPKPANQHSFSRIAADANIQVTGGPARSLVKPRILQNIGNPGVQLRPHNGIAQNTPASQRPIELYQGVVSPCWTVPPNRQKNISNISSLVRISNGNPFPIQNNPEERSPPADGSSSRDDAFPSLPSSEVFQHQLPDMHQANHLRHSIAGINVHSSVAQWLYCACPERSWDFDDIGTLALNFQAVSPASEGFLPAPQTSTPSKESSPRRLYCDVLANRSATVDTADSSYDELERQALEQYQHQDMHSSSDASTEDKFKELEQQAIEQYHSSTTLIDSSESCSYMGESMPTCVCGRGCPTAYCSTQRARVHKSMSSEDVCAASWQHDGKSSTAALGVEPADPRVADADNRHSGQPANLRRSASNFE
ncbi:uncharacterized protein LOC134539312 [Bacillus rossius redtenbacheri]|uniref:uncharacterized protein LOC134539312 n=1 Tax=Bacillus rossius redtenbacheri TaxID=93214 RepID=UPI002FDDC1E1